LIIFYKPLDKFSHIAGKNNLLNEIFKKLEIEVNNSRKPLLIKEKMAL
jgi:hypothetical protein